MGGAGDLRQVGSGNIGATNVLRTGRKGLAAATLLLDHIIAEARALVVTGTRDTSTPYDGHGEHLLARIPDARHVALDAAHLAPLEAPDPLAAALIDFLA